MLIMGACDDIAYPVVDAEDAVRKRIVSCPDPMEWLRGQKGLAGDELRNSIMSVASAGARQARVGPAAFRAE